MLLDLGTGAGQARSYGLSTWRAALWSVALLLAAFMAFNHSKDYEKAALRQLPHTPAALRANLASARMVAPTSSGSADGLSCSLSLNGRSILRSTTRGMNVVILDGTSPTVKATRTFDMSGDVAASAKMIAWLDQNAVVGDVGVFVGGDKGSEKLNDAARSKLAADFGAQQIQALGLRDSYVLISRKGGPLIEEVRKQRFSGSVSVSAAIGDCVFDVKIIPVRGERTQKVTDTSKTVAALQVTYDNSTYTCTGAPADANNFHFRGANLGGWLVLEPWLTPSLFYQFLGKTKDYVARDTYTFCSVLSADVARAQLQNHWHNWVTEAHIAKLASTGIDTLRLPVGDYMFVPYGPYVDCMVDAMTELQRVLGLISKYNLTAILDVHAMRYSQNGADHSGRSRDITWLSDTEYSYNPNEHFFDTPDNLNHATQVIQNLVNMFKGDPTVVGLGVLNEPRGTNISVALVQKLYWDSYLTVRSNAPNWVVLMDTNFVDTTAGNFMYGCPKFAFERHIYQAWDTYTSQDEAINGANWHPWEGQGPVVVGEWSLATDTCALWLEGFNFGWPSNNCQWISCPSSYMNLSLPNAPAPLDTSKGAQSPYGQYTFTDSAAYIKYGKCPIDVPWGSGTYGDEQQFLTKLGQTKISNFETTHGWFFWNFRTELEVRWDFIRSYDLGYVRW